VDTAPHDHDVRPNAARPGGAWLRTLLGVGLTLLGGISFLWLLDVEWIRRTAAPNLAVMVAGVVICLMATARRPRAVGAVGLAMTLGMTAMFVFGVFFAALPPPQTFDHAALATASSPAGERTQIEEMDFTLPGTDGGEVRLASYLGRGPVLLVFYRGFW
jgi:hypothetical protein